MASLTSWLDFVIWLITRVVKFLHENSHQDPLDGHYRLKLTTCDIFGVSVIEETGLIVFYQLDMYICNRIIDNSMTHVTSSLGCFYFCFGFFACLFVFVFVFVFVGLSVYGCLSFLLFLSSVITSLVVLVPPTRFSNLCLR